ncbi:MAG TPA: hypothetical protein VFL79_02115 [Terriglobia bacterium]|nr:hypothetical protein [Terriglobia bacterium]
MRNYKKLTAGLISGWFIFALVAAALNVFKNNVSGIGVVVAMASGVPIAAFGIWFSASKCFRSFALSLSPRVLSLAQLWRILGLTFVLMALGGTLPKVFGLTAGLGDMLIGVTAPLVALRLATPNRRSAFIAWQLLGMADLVTAVGLGVTTSLFSSQSALMAPMTVLPLSLVPTFIVPLLFMVHIVCIAQARRWAAAGRAHASAERILARV